MGDNPSILTNMAFTESRLWRESVRSICREGESPDILPAHRQAWRLFRQRGSHDIVVTMGPRPSLAYGLLCAACRTPSRQILTEIFLDLPSPYSPLWRIKTRLFQLVARRALGMLVNSSGEIPLLSRRFGIPQDRIQFVPLCTTLPDPALRAENRGTVVSIGRTLRDLDTLWAAAPLIPAPIILAAGHSDVLPTPIPANLSVHRELPMAEVRHLLATAAVVVIPLKPCPRATGQVILLEAMAMGKPVVATRAVGTVDYVRSGENGLLVNPEQPRELADAVNRLLQHPELAQNVGKRALEDCLQNWMPDHHARRKLEAIVQLWRLGKGSRPF